MNNWCYHVHKDGKGRTRLCGVRASKKVGDLWACERHADEIAAGLPEASIGNNMYRGAKLPDDTPLYAGMSFFQKSIRRGLENWAKYWARQFFLAGGGCETWLWRRMLTIAGEDIGIADLGVTAEIVRIVMTQQTRWKLIGKPKHMNGKPGHNALLAVFASVLVLCRAKKSRACDDAAVWFNTHPTWKPPIDPAAYEDVEIPAPDFAGKSVAELKKYIKDKGLNADFVAAALDKHVGGSGKGLDHFLKDGAHLENKSDVVGFTPPEAP